MSSAGRGANRFELDYYRTKNADAELFFREWIKDDPAVADDLRAGNILDPCAGGNLSEVRWQYKKPTEKSDGIVVVPPSTMTYPEAANVVVPGAGTRFVTNDLREDSPAALHEDFLSDDWFMDGFDMVVTNPPFAKALDVVKRSLEVVRPGGRVAMFLSLHFWGSEERHEFLKSCKPEREFVHHHRPGFLPNSSTDSIEYAHFVWRAGMKFNYTMTRSI